MGYRQIELKAPTSYTDDWIHNAISRNLRIREFTYAIENKSLDARNKNKIHWLLNITVFSDEIKGEGVPVPEMLHIPYRKRNKQIIVVGSGPAGFFSSFVLQQAGFQTTLIERGSEVQKRSHSVLKFERDGIFDPANNYAFGEGGAGTFSDGKLTSRSKHISKERRYILKSYIEAGAPKEILWLAHPHLGTDNLKIMVKTLRQNFQKIGGKLLFETMLEDLKINNGKVFEVVTSAGSFPADALFLAPGHSAYETFRMLICRGVVFRTKNFAIGSRMEHSQEIINLSQWGKPSLPGVKAAEYRITSPGDGRHQVYSFCMCPGGIVVPATAYHGTSIVNGMSYYKRNSLFANAGCVAGIHPDELAGKQISALEAIDLLEQLERYFYDFSGGYAVPSCSIRDFIDSRLRTTQLESSYPLGLNPAPLWELLPKNIVKAMQAGLLDFIRKIKGIESGNLIGLESKTSSPIQVLRENDGLCTGFKNLYMVGEGSGYAGGIISSAADGVKAAIRFSGL